jgi:diguanylate cyclase (GGDEF)-like protein
MKILLIEDNPTDADFLRASLKRSRADDIELTHLCTLKEGTIALRTDEFDIVLLDMGLPDGNGMDCVEAVQEANSDIPIVVLSGQDDEDFAVSILNKGVQDYLVKWEGKGRVILRSIRYAVERKRAELRLSYLAQYDGLTGLPNRESLPGHLTSAIARAQRAKTNVALFYMDLNDFKAINDLLTHEVGDVLLKEVAERLTVHTRGGDALCRLGGDEFAIIVEGLSRAADADSIARNLINALLEPFTINGKEVVVTASVGITVFPDDSEEIQILLKNADIAMYKAKESGQNEFKFFTENMQNDITEKHKLQDDLQEAMQAKQFSVVYQPKVHMHTHQLLGLEALIRWDHPTRGEVMPEDFIPTAEESGQILPIGNWVFTTACEAIKSWKEQDVKIVPVSVNISVKQFQQEDFVEKIAGILDANGIDPELIELEMTEGLLMGDIEVSLQRLNALKKMGLRISIDDFGTGNSCLAYLQKFPIDILKIDKSFVDEVTLDADSDHICKAIISLAKSLSMICVAEGVETERQLEFLNENGCDMAQGFLFGHPAVEKDTVELLRDAKKNFSSLKPVISSKSNQTANLQIMNVGSKFLT